MVPPRTPPNSGLPPSPHLEHVGIFVEHRQALSFDAPGVRRGKRGTQPHILARRVLLVQLVQLVLPCTRDPLPPSYRYGEDGDTETCRCHGCVQVHSEVRYDWIPGIEAVLSGGAAGFCFKACVPLLPTPKHDQRDWNRCLHWTSSDFLANSIVLFYCLP